MFCVVAVVSMQTAQAGPLQSFAKRFYDRDAKRLLPVIHGLNASWPGFRTVLNHTKRRDPESIQIGATPAAFRLLSEQLGWGVATPFKQIRLQNLMKRSDSVGWLIQQAASHSGWSSVRFGVDDNKLALMLNGNTVSRLLDAIRNPSNTIPRVHKDSVVQTPRIITKTLRFGWGQRIGIQIEAAKKFKLDVERNGRTVTFTGTEAQYRQYREHVTNVLKIRNPVEHPFEFRDSI